ncbi:diamine acetyltransferase 1-like [Podarcis lilfordi]|uniref:Diamine acetyltransferase 1-like n=1 Tax=Podarcis lilfordi TaxID=74358 RepID=A0AA35L964_9SAUR|nr:diamine acetyltransferase 1-like [Podarcis lilfordi]
MSFIIRPCAPKDLKDIMRLVKEIAGIYNVPLGSLRTNVEELKKAGFGEQTQYECLVAEVPAEEKSKEGYTLIGYTLFSYTYNTWRGKNIYMDNLYVMPEFRGRRIGKALMEQAGEVARRQGLSQLRMHVSSQKADVLSFLERRGGENLTDKDGWHLLRFSNEALRRLAAEKRF